MIKLIDLLLEFSDYRGHHTAPGKDSSPLHNLRNVYGDNFYDIGIKKAVYYYGINRDKDNIDAFSIMYEAKDNPKYKLKIYRAVPPNVEMVINSGDWVTIIENYAKEHGKSWVDDNYKIISKDVTADQVFTWGDDPFEYGYVK
jgi:hypothetical protein